MLKSYMGWVIVAMIGVLSKDFSFRPGPLWTNFVLELIGIGFGLGQGGLDSNKRVVYN